MGGDEDVNQNTIISNNVTKGAVSCRHLLAIHKQCTTPIPQGTV
jgi:hypothetical protein